MTGSPTAGGTPGGPPTAHDGLLVVDKAAGWTSHDVVARCRRQLGQKKVGHAGTLDPDATGVLLVGAGRVTRLLRFLAPLPKCYQGELVLGSATTTLDASGDVTGTWDMSGVTPDQVARAAADLTGTISQVPPMVSAVQVGGTRLHQLARQGITVDRAPRRVTVESFTVAPTGAAGTAGSSGSTGSTGSAGSAGSGARFRFEVRCSSGTYVRALVDDLGRALGGGAHLGVLRRTAVGPFSTDGAVPVEEVDATRLLPPAATVAHLETLAVDGADRDAVGHGRALEAAAVGARGDGPYAVVDGDGRLLAVYERPAPDSERLTAAVVVGPV